MYRLLVVCSLAAAAAAAAFSRDPATAAILGEQRQLNDDGSSDVAYAQEDGVIFKESTNAEGERRGSYEYVGDDGKTYRVDYVAGVGGFRIINSSGHVDNTPDLPVGPAREPEVTQPRPATRRQQTTTNTFTSDPATSSYNINYDLSQEAPAPVRNTYVVATTTSTTTQRPVRKNYHTGKVALERSDRGYTYSYTHNAGR